MGEQGNGMWAELRRRRVVSTAAAYAAVSFILLQLGEILFPAFGLGAGAMRALFALLFGAFPVVIALSWVYDVTAAGLRRTDDGSRADAPRRGAVVAVVASSLLLGSVAWWAVQTVPVVGPRAEAASIAVLPFSDFSERGDQRYLGDGMAEEILNVLAGVEGLRVAARTSSFAFRGEGLDVFEIGQRLNVAHLVEGSVRRDSLHVRVTAQLIDTRTGFHLWSANFDRGASDLFAVQDEIAASIVEALLGELELTAVKPTRRVASPQAHEAYLRARAQWNRRDALGIPSAIELFQEALTIDSMYPEAHAGLADSYALLPYFAPSVSAAESLDRAEVHARRAIDLDPELAEAHASLGLVKALRQDRAGALTSLDRAIALNPSYAPARHWRGNVLAEQSRLPEAVVDMGLAAQLDPLSPAIASDHGNVLLWSGATDAAKAEFARAQRLQFGFGPALFGTMLVALAQDDPVSLQMSLTQWAAVSRVPLAAAGPLASAMIAHRDLGVASPVPDELVAAAEAGMVSAGVTAALHALVGDEAGVLLWLQRAVEDRSWVDQYLVVNPIYAPYRGVSGFGVILDLVGARVNQ